MIETITKLEPLLWEEFRQIYVALRSNWPADTIDWIYSRWEPDTPVVRSHPYRVEIHWREK